MADAATVGWHARLSLINGLKDIGIHSAAAVAGVLFNVSVQVAVVLTRLTPNALELYDLAPSLKNIVVDTALIARHTRILSLSERGVKSILRLLWHNNT